MRSSVTYLKETIFLSNCKSLWLYKGFFGNNTVSGFYVRPSRKVLREDLRSDHADEVAVFLSSKAAKEEIRIVLTVKQLKKTYAKCCLLDQEQEYTFQKKCTSRSTKKIVDIASLLPTVQKFTIFLYTPRPAYDEIVE